MTPSTPSELERLLPMAHALADAARGNTLPLFRTPLEVVAKLDDSPVTVADRAAEASMRELLNTQLPDHGILGEEHGRERMDAEYLWVLDPIDGTKSFVRGYPMFSTQIALMYRGELVLGVSHASAYRETAWARRGGGAFLNGVPCQVAATADWSKAALSTGNLKTLAGSPSGWQALAGLVRGAHRIRGYGDFLHYHLLAAGRIDCVIESDVNILDIAALVVILREAGGVFTNLEGGAVDLATTSVLAGTPAMHAHALAAMQ